MMMHSWGFFGFLMFLILVVYPTGRVLSRIGFSGWWALLAFIPIVNVIALWVVAFGDWPGEKRSNPAPAKAAGA